MRDGEKNSRDLNNEGVGKREFPVSENTKNRGFLEARITSAQDPHSLRHMVDIKPGG